VSWHDAVDYADWLAARDGVAYRLPTEAEWEHAARGRERFLFPWGDFWNGGYVNANKSHSEGSPLPVDQAPNNTTDVSPAGVFALGGNVSEWTGSAFAPYPGSRHKPTRRDLSSKVIRGGSFNLEPNSARAAFRFWELPEFSSDDLGFRLAADPPGGGPR
jgi:formylglycine-generating enzyme required for sulfatase activity